MHELSLCESLVSLLEEKALELGFHKVKKIVLKTGPLALIEPEAMKFSFSIASKGTIAEGAELHIEEILVKAYCLSCQKEGFVGKIGESCPNCEGVMILSEEGKELTVDSIEVE
ncbi:hydrogenase maturation nickel metallochaperone HypA [Candidatus Methylacidiphilum fumarolicum]|uniref:Hydrogenase maturation factor HypA n=2 Tax=Candidatus Methylacidiphilum fumarolicum TaxID=591154 RepID=I0JZP4_METFB|nr:hydrogenase maturation nickel metallochaperone HypA [Candidatus Methylacidiphilum fumarolicum]MBW6414601.1 hydrogenase maturation nickel metallochaperone HypA [Candidatus Methylacidiphilum fumarolicum]TFE70883.1 hydrogenase nickel insertion protein HypA [Candidatus Methylacidiphilum fumarolicum]TFE71856.1 hydrogenase maturation nickel metallochaperone HypA [Candidatus Methylacidiphilum fumarolicum]TFE75150.1 hydrogenase maturation nickel metallochaperone HypA [Candidatus Methylacidiphilum fu